MFRDHMTNVIFGFYRKKYLETPETETTIEEEKRISSAVHPGEAPVTTTEE